ncbi:hypothetical protein GGS21DRAFT_304046 [Xylaria nigripes]|nr:hypothetical protein GGS21DRAFT_304046 [Xylaria nigripes]
MTVHLALYTSFWLEFELLNDGLETSEVVKLPLTQWHRSHNPVFRRFPDLPPELRLKVWEYLIAPRIVGIACITQEDFGIHYSSKQRELWRFESIVRPSTPVLLHVNQETRSLALRHYELSFEWRVPLVLRDSLPPTSRPPLPSVRRPTPARHPAVDIYDIPGNPPPHIGSGTGGSGDPESTYSENTRSAQIASHGLDLPNRALSGRESSPARTWFNFDLDAVYLLGDLEPCDVFGLSGPMPYFISAQIAHRVRKVFVSFRALNFGGTGIQQIFGALFHVADRFSSDDGEMLVCVNAFDESTHRMIGNPTKLLSNEYWTEMMHRSSVPNVPGRLPRNENNILQQIWNERHQGNIAGSPLAPLKFYLIAHDHLKHYLDEFILANPPERRSRDTSSESE